MKTADDGERFLKRPFQQEINKEPQNASQSVVSEPNYTHRGGNLAASIGISELEQILIQKSFTRSEIQHLIDLLHSRLTKESPSDIVVVERDGSNLPPGSPYPVIKVEASTSKNVSLNIYMHGDERDNFHAAVFSSRVVEEQIASPSRLANLSNNNVKCFPKTPQHPKTIESLPVEVLVNIFIRLLAKQLGQMRSVSKFWRDLLSQLSFTKAHLHHSIHKKDQMFLAFCVYEQVEDLETYTSQLLTLRTCPSSHLELTNSIKLPINPQFENARTGSLIGCVNGLICYSHSETIIHIWNPSLSTVLTLPPYSLPSGDCRFIRINFRFGFDPKTNDYKVVKITGLTTTPRSGVQWWLQIEIYSMRKGSWGLITGRFPSHIRRVEKSDYECVDGHDGHLHWLCYIGEEKDSKTIVAFDMSSETFREIPLPDSTLDESYDSALGVWSGKLCVISRNRDKVFEVWVMEEYGVAESWVKRHVFPHFEYASIHGLTSRNEFLLVVDGYIVLYDPIANKETCLKKSCYYSSKIVEYVDSLVWVAPADRDKRERSQV